jgi:hypothetical protein
MSIAPITYNIQVPKGSIGPYAYTQYGFFGWQTDFGGTLYQNQGWLTVYDPPPPPTAKTGGFVVTPAATQFSSSGPGQVIYYSGFTLSITDTGWLFSPGALWTFVLGYCSPPPNPPTWGAWSIEIAVPFEVSCSLDTCCTCNSLPPAGYGVACPNGLTYSGICG